MGVQGLNWYRFSCDECDDQSRPVCAPTVAEAERLFNNSIERPWLIEIDYPGVIDHGDTIEVTPGARVTRVLCPYHRERLLPVLCVQEENRAAVRDA